MTPNEAIDAIHKEYESATSLFPKFHSAHEGLAVLWEEFRELKIEVFMHQSRRDPEKMRDEAIQVGAMAMRFLTDVDGSR